MGEAEKGLRAFLFCDVAGSVHLLNRAERSEARQGDAGRKQAYPAEIKRAVRDIFAASCASAGGRFYFGEWDEFRAVFPDADGAVSAATASIERLGAYHKEVLAEAGVPAVRLHCAIHFGEAEPNPVPEDRPYAEDYGGKAVELASRLMKLARPNQILLSKEARENLGDKKMQSKYSGEYLLKGIGWRPLYAYTDKSIPLNTRFPLALGTPLIFRGALAAGMVTLAAIGVARTAWRWQTRNPLKSLQMASCVHSASPASRSCVSPLRRYTVKSCAAKA
jgi:class 3 adenylate cyclase